MAWYKTNKFKYALAGALFGCCFPIMAVSIDLLRLGLSFSWTNIVWVQLEFPIHLIINTAPLFLGLFALVGGVRQDTIEAMNSLLRAEMKNTNLIKDRMENELNIAKEIQLSMLPMSFMKEKNITIYADLIPAREVGGDFYDFYFLDDAHLCFVVGDVSGKGVPAALTMAVCKTLLKAIAQTTYSTAEILARANQEMSKDNTSCMFITAFFAILNIQTGMLKYSNAGHNAPYIKKTNGTILKLNALHGTVLAAMETTIYTESTTQLDKGDVIFAYTDGIPEAHNTKNELFSTQKLDKLVLDTPFHTPEQFVKTIVQTTQEFEKGQEQFDDITALCLYCA